MPQDGSNNYYYPPGTPGIPDTTIESEAYNTFLDDLVINDLNIARPIHRGGTGADNADTALTNLGAEKASQIVSNFDDHVWKNGSFWADTGATASPEPGSYIVGSATLLNFLQTWMCIEATSIQSGRVYTRRNPGGTWGAWVEQLTSLTDGDTRYVNLNGDEMTGNLAIKAPAPVLVINKTDPSQNAAISGYYNNLSRWVIVMGMGGAESAPATGSDFFIGRYANDGSWLGIPLSINRASGATIIESLNVSSGTASTSVTTGALTVAGGLGVAQRAWIQQLTVGGSPLGYTTAFKVAADQNLVFFDGTTDGFTMASLNDANNAYRPLQIVSSLTKMNAPLNLVSIIASTSSTTGALTVAGGVGVAGAMHVGNGARFTGLGITSGTGKGVELLSDGTNAYVQGFDRTTSATCPLSLEASVVKTNAPIQANSTTASTSTTTGALTVAGGVGIGESLFVGNGAAVGPSGISTSGDLVISKTQPSLYIRKNATTGQECNIIGQMGLTARWRIILGDSAAEIGSNSGSDFYIQSFNDSGGFATTAMGITRATGAVNFYNAVTAGSGITISASGLAIQAGGLTVQAGGIFCNTSIVAGYGHATNGTYYFGNTLANYLAYSGSNFTLNGGGLIINAATVGSGYCYSTTGLQGTGSPWSVNLLYAYPNATITMAALHYNGSWYGMRIDSNGSAQFDFRHDASAVKSGGSVDWVITSDARIKNVLGDYTSGLDAIAALHPVRYTFKGNETQAPPSMLKDGQEPEKDKIYDPLAVPYVNSLNYGPAVDEREYIGLVAQEAEVTMPEIVLKNNGYIDGVEVSDLRSLDTTPLLFALINAVKELKARVEELENPT